MIIFHYPKINNSHGYFVPFLFSQYFFTSSLHKKVRDIQSIFVIMVKIKKVFVTVLAVRAKSNIFIQRFNELSRDQDFLSAEVL